MENNGEKSPSSKKKDKKDEKKRSKEEKKKTKEEKRNKKETKKKDSKQQQSNKSSSSSQKKGSRKNPGSGHNSGATKPKQVSTVDSSAEDSTEEVTSVESEEAATLGGVLTGGIAGAAEREGPAAADTRPRNVARFISTEGRVAEEDSEDSMLQITKKGLDALGLRYEVHDPPPSPNDSVITFGMNSDCGMSKVIIHIKEAENKFSLYMKAPVSVPEAHRTNAALFFTYVNYGLANGNFEMDLSDGEVRLKISHLLPGSKLTTDMVSLGLCLSLHMLGKFFPGLMAVCFGSKDPKQAHDDCMKEGPDSVQQAQ